MLHGLEVDQVLFVELGLLAGRRARRARYLAHVHADVALGVVLLLVVRARIRVVADGTVQGVLVVRGVPARAVDRRSIRVCAAGPRTVCLIRRSHQGVLLGAREVVEVR